MINFKNFKINELKEDKEKVETTLLDSIGRDLTELAKENKFDPTIGRVKEIDEVVAILARRRKNNPVLIGDPGVGKAQPLDSLVLTPNGWVRMGDLKVGDSVITPKGKKSRINGVYPQGRKDIYKIIFEDGRSAEACGEHLWKVYGIPEGKNRKRAWSIIDTDKIREVLENTNYKLKIPLIENIDIHNDSFIVEPYTMGILLGDGNIGENVVKFTTDDYQIYEMVKSEVSNELTVNKITNNKNNRTDSYVININKDILPKTRYYKGDRLHTYLREFDNLKLTGVKSYDKFIPEKYKNSSFKSKLSIIQGLLDSDGGVTKTGSVYFNSTSYRLVKDLQEIIWSIGGIANIKEKQTSYNYKGVKKEGRKSYNLSIRYKNPKDLFRLERKKQRLSDNYQYSKLLKNNIVNVEYIGKKEAQCIMIDDCDHLYITNDYIVTHNTAIVEGIAQIISNSDDCPETLKGKRIVELDMATIMAGTSNQGDLEKRVKRIIKELEDNPDVIVFIDEIHMIVDSNKPIDVSNMFKPALARGEMRCIGATTEKEYKIIEKDSALERRFQKVSVGEPTQEETIEILKRLKDNYGKYHGVEYTDDAVVACVKLAGRYITDRFFPDKAIDLLDEVGARMRVRKTKSKELKDLELELHKIGERKNKLLKSQKFEEAGELRKSENEIKLRLEDLTKSEDKIVVDKKDVEAVMSKKLDLPELKSDDEDVAKKYLELSDKLKMDVIGQDEAVTKVSKLLRRNAAGLKDPNRPSGVFLFLGSTGVGKTHLVKTLAKNIFGSESAMIRLDMSEYGEKHNVARLIGCFHPNTMIQLSNGDSKQISKINIGDYVITHKGNKKKVIDKYEYDNTDGYLDSYRISNRNIKLQCTPQHEILAIKPSYYNRRIDKKSYSIDNAKFYQSKDINKGDIVLYPKNIKMDEIDNKKTIDLINYLPDSHKYKVSENYIWHNLNGIKINRHVKIDENLARLGGYYISEGGSNKNRKSIKFTFNNKELDYIDEVIFLLKNIFSEDINYNISPNRNATNIVVSSRIINLFLSDLFGRTAYEKKIPNILSSKELFFNLLETMIYGDGSKTIDRRLTYTTVSNTLAYQLSTYLKSYGLSTQLNKIDSHVDKRGYESSDIYKIILSGFNISKLNNYLPNYKHTNSEIKPKNIQRLQHQDDNYYYYQIISKDKVPYDGKVYDISIEDDSTYIANGISVHNSPPGYVGYGEGGQLTEKVRRKPYSIILLDELEKAHPDVLNVLLQVFEDGHLTDGQGKKVDFKNTIIIMTSNIGARVAAETARTPVGFSGTGVDKTAIEEETAKETIKKELRKALAPEFLNRIDDIIIFSKLSKESIYKIIDVELAKVRKKLDNMGYTLEITDNLKDLLIEKGYDSSLGARPLKRAIVKYIEDPISEEILRKTITDKIVMDYDKDSNKVLINGNQIIERSKNVLSWKLFNIK